MAANPQRESALATLVEQLERIEQQIASLEADRKAVSRAIDILSRRPDYFDTPPAVVDQHAGSSWRDLKAQEAVLRFLRENGTNWLKASEIARALKARGVKGTKHFPTVIDATVRRLAKDGKIAQKKNDRNVSVFRIRKEEAGPEIPEPASPLNDSAGVAESV